MLDQQHSAFARKTTTREYIEAIGTAVLIALFLRAFVVEAFKIPSGSMIPTLQVGDHIFVNKFIYGVRIPYTNFKIGMGIRKPRRGGGDRLHLPEGSREGLHQAHRRRRRRHG